MLNKKSICKGVEWKMVKQKTTRKELLKSPDEFLSLSSKALAFARERSRLFSYAGMVLVVCLLAYLGINTYLNYVDRKGQEAYDKAYATVEAMGLKTDREALIKSEEQFRKVMVDYGLSDVSRLAGPQLAYLNFLEGKYDDAIPHYREFLKTLPEKAPYRSLAELALAACYEEKGNYEQAVEMLKSVTSQKEDLFREQAMLGLARVYRLSKQRELAKGVLKEFVDTYKNSPFLAMAKAFLEGDPS